MLIACLCSFFFGMFLGMLTFALLRAAANEPPKCPLCAAQETEES